MIVVTGAAGFIGSNLLADLEAAGEGPLVAVDWLGCDERWRNIENREIADFLTPEQLLPFLQVRRSAVTAIIHMGAISATTERDAGLILERNVQYTARLWDWCAEAGVPFIYASSAATYGDGTQGFADDDSIAALARLRPLNLYGWSKHVVDRRFARLVENGSPRPKQWVGLKFFNVFGPNEAHKNDMRSVVNKLFFEFRQNKRVKLFKSHRDEVPDGQQMRDFVYVRDCSATVLWFLKNPAVSGIFNVGSGHARSYNDIVNSLGAALGTEIPVEFIDMPDQLRSQYQYFTQADMSKLRRVGYTAPLYALEPAVTEYVGTYLNRADSFR